jgi:hypothetical protein
LTPLLLFDSFRSIAGVPWKVVPLWQLCVTSVGFAGLMYFLRTAEEGFIFIDFANLAFHEAGHPIFGLLGPTMELYGGTLGQLVFPVVSLGAFWARREPVGYAVAGVWLFENFLNIARYMADARAQILPLVGGGEHDWTNIFTRWGVLSSDTVIAHWMAGAGWLGMLAMWAWLIWQWRRRHQTESMSA